MQSPPVMNAAGTIKTLAQVEDALKTAMESVMVGSFTFEARNGNSNRNYFNDSTMSLNSIGLPGPGIKEWEPIVTGMAERAHDVGKSLWVSVAGFDPAEYVMLTDAALAAGADRVELNLGCPNVWGDGGQKPIASYNVNVVDEIVGSVGAEFDLEDIGVKMSPIFDPVLFPAVAMAVRQVAFVTTMNTVPNCFAWDTEGSALEFGDDKSGTLGGLSGPVIKPIALGQVAQWRNFLGPTAEIIGVGGIVSGGDVNEFLAIGANSTQIAHAWMRHGPDVIERIVRDIDITVALY